MTRFALALFLAFPALAAETMDTVVVQDVQEKAQRTGVVKDTIIKTEVISAKTMERKSAKTIADAIENEPGIDTQNTCSICGIKRVQINGLKGEYTTVLMDDVPINSTVSGYYGFDAMVTAGIARIEVARGSGASLLAPEAIGGVINIITKKATENSVAVDLAGGNAEYRALSVVGTGVSQDGTKRVTVSAQHNMQGQWDADNNGVNESPRKSNYSAMARVSSDLGVNTNLDIRVAALKSSTFGGPMKGTMFATAVNPATGATFDGGDVRKKLTGGPNWVNETIELERIDGAARLTQIVSDNTNVAATVSVAHGTQDSFYETNDYFHFNENYFADLRVNHQLFATHLLTFGGDVRKEILRSQSEKYFNKVVVPPAQPIAKDDFDLFSPGLYLQDTWTPFEKLEVAGALRFNLIQVDWRGQTAKQNEIDKGVVVPRVHLKYLHTPELISRLSYGQGYRAPLTFFESEHGILDNGFDINISDIETSHSGVYSLSYDDKKLAATVSGSWTGINHLAYIDMTGTRPALKNDFGYVSVGNVDLLASYQLLSSLQLGAGYEHFFYSQRYKSLLPTAAIEDRVRVMADWAQDGWEANVTVNIVGGRDLAPYNYGNRFNVYDGVTASVPKGTTAPAWATVDLRVAKKIGKEVSLNVGVKNLFDYTQTKTESPLFYDAKGGLDVLHIWGPLRGRQIYAGIQAKF